MFSRVVICCHDLASIHLIGWGNPQAPACEDLLLRNHSPGSEVSNFCTPAIPRLGRFFSLFFPGVFPFHTIHDGGETVHPLRWPIRHWIDFKGQLD